MESGMDFDREVSEALEYQARTTALLKAVVAKDKKERERRPRGRRRRRRGRRRRQRGRQGRPRQRGRQGSSSSARTGGSAASARTAAAAASASTGARTAAARARSSRRRRQQRGLWLRRLRGDGRGGGKHDTGSDEGGGFVAGIETRQEAARAAGMRGEPFAECSWREAVGSVKTPS